MSGEISADFVLGAIYERVTRKRQSVKERR
jgi:hypothetical protein